VLLHFLKEGQQGLAVGKFQRIVMMLGYCSSVTGNSG
jgi:hypothetical protein